jgi:DNA-binding NtrC family response regulator
MSFKSILVIDDDTFLCDSIADYYRRSFIVYKANTGEKGLELSKLHRPDIVVLDQNLPDGDGVDFCSRILAQSNRSKIIFITAYPEFSLAVRATKAGAFDYVAKPFDPAELELRITNAARTADLELAADVHQYEKAGKKIIGLDSISKEVETAARTKANVLITGETGTGKTVIAKAIHQLSDQSSAPFVSVNCSTIPESLFESELFGHEKGAFTGAAARRKGAFEIADRGTVFLDEIGEIPLHIQSKLLYVCDGGNFRRVGSETEIGIDARIISATNRDLGEEVAKSNFRADLFHRINVLRIHLPPLRERQRDIESLTKYFLDELACGEEIVLPDEELSRLRSYAWPGNVRELRNVLERAVILRESKVLKPSTLLEVGGNSAVPSTCETATIETLQDVELRHISRALNANSGNHAKTAHALGISLSTLKRRIKQFSLG